MRDSEIKEMFCRRLAAKIGCEVSVIEAAWAEKVFKSSNVFRFLVIDIYNELIPNMPHIRCIYEISDRLNVSDTYVLALYKNYYSERFG
jgi:hypothetical protein